MQRTSSFSTLSSWEKNNNGCSTPRETRRRGFLGWDNLRKGKKEKGKRKIGKRRS
jgi:hypothetical protein